MAFTCAHTMYVCALCRQPDPRSGMRDTGREDDYWSKLAEVLEHRSQRMREGELSIVVEVHVELSMILAALRRPPIKNRHETCQVDGCALLIPRRASVMPNTYPQSSAEGLTEYALGKIGEAKDASGFVTVESNGHLLEPVVECKSYQAGRNTDGCQNCGRMRAEHDDQK